MNESTTKLTDSLELALKDAVEANKKAGPVGSIILVHLIAKIRACRHTALELKDALEGGQHESPKD
jgi:hypothetical protein